MTFKSTSTTPEMRYAVLGTTGELAIEKGAKNKMVSVYNVLKGLRIRFPDSEITKPDVDACLDVLIGKGLIRYFDFESNDPKQPPVRVFGVSKKGWDVLYEEEQKRNKANQTQGAI